MATVKQYIIWQPVWMGRNVAVHLAPQINNNWNYKRGKITCTELSYGNITDEDSRYLAIIEYDDAQYKAKHIQRAMASVAPWVARTVTPEQVITYCNRWYPAPEGEPAYFSLDADGFTVVDNRPVLEDI